MLDLQPGCFCMFPRCRLCHLCMDRCKTCMWDIWLVYCCGVLNTWTDCKADITARLSENSWNNPLPYRSILQPGYTGDLPLGNMSSTPKDAISLKVPTSKAHKIIQLWESMNSNSWIQVRSRISWFCNGKLGPLWTTLRFISTQVAFKLNPRGCHVFTSLHRQCVRGRTCHAVFETVENVLKIDDMEWLSSVQFDEVSTQPSVSGWTHGWIWVGRCMKMYEWGPQ